MNVSVHADSYFYLHIPKTAGHSVTGVVRQEFSAAEICERRRWDQMTGATREELARYRFFMGHLWGDLPAWLGRSLREFTVLRDPVQRLVSQYFQNVRATHHKRQDPEGLESLTHYLQHPRWSPYVWNYQAHVLADTSPPAVHLNWARNPGDSAVPWIHLSDRIATGQSDERILAAAIARLDGMVCVGVTERLQPFVEVLAHRLDWNLFDEPAHKNANPRHRGEYPLTSKERELILERVSLDSVVYGHAVKLHSAQWVAMEEDRRNSPQGWVARCDGRYSSLQRKLEEQNGHIEKLLRDVNSLGVRIGQAAQSAASRVLPAGSLGFRSGSRLRRALQRAIGHG